MDEKKALKAGDPCPQCGGEFAVDHTQAPDAVIRRHREGSQYPEPHARFRERVLEKVAASGVIHVCTTCGYRSRFHAAEPTKGKGKAA